MPSIFCRKLLVVTFIHQGDEFNVGTVHLESLNNHRTRESQFNICRQAFMESLMLSYVAKTKFGLTK